LRKKTTGRNGKKREKNHGVGNVSVSSSRKVRPLSSSPRGGDAVHKAAWPLSGGVHKKSPAKGKGFPDAWGREVVYKYSGNVLGGGG